MQVRILDLDGAVARQPRVARLASRCLPLRHWGPRLRLACAWGPFAAFGRDLTRMLGGTHDRGPAVTFVGSGDFHHVSLALLRRQRRACNLLVLDNHPDWMLRVPFLHCGTWLAHAAALPQVRRVFHVGGDVDFDNAYRWLAPWPGLRSGKIVAVPAVRRFAGAGWGGVSHEPLRARPDEPAGRDRIERLLDPWREELAESPLYVSLDRDVMRAEEAAVNWDSGHLTRAEVKAVVEAFLWAAPFAGMDVVGDWSPVRVRGAMRQWFHWSMHPSLDTDEARAAAANEPFNAELVALVGSAARGASLEGRTTRTAGAREREPAKGMTPPGHGAHSPWGFALARSPVR